jgi:TP901 family phage tail tape measure protein
MESTESMEKELKEMGIYTKDENDNFLTMGELFKQINDKWGNLSLENKTRICFLLSAVSFRILGS